MTNWGKLKLLTSLISIISLFASYGIVSASSANISHAYHTSLALNNGNIVSLDPLKPNYVQPANTQNAARLLGVAISPKESLLAVDPGNGLVQVATDGTANVLVSDLNGNIAVGDFVAVSPFNGVGMKAVSGSRVLGLAQTTLTKATSGSSLISVKDDHGKNSQIRVGYIKLNIAIGTNSIASVQLNSLQKIVKQITGKTVTMFRIIVSLIILSIAMLALVSLIYSAIYSSIVAIGRNPLAKHSVFKNLSGVVLMAILVASIALISVYFLLS